jgi:hypothetical protein
MLISFELFFDLASVMCMPCRTHRLRQGRKHFIPNNSCAKHILDESKSVLFLYIDDERKEVQVKILSFIKHNKGKLFFQNVINYSLAKVEIHKCLVFGSQHGQTE